MSGLRLNLGRLPWAACFALGLLWFCEMASCTKPTPGYCDGTTNNPCHDGKICCLDNMPCEPKFLCWTPDGGSSGTGGGGGSTIVDVRVDPDAGSDAPADRPVTTDDGGADLRDAVNDRADGADGPKACPGGCAADGGTPICDTTTGVCVGCRENTDCPSVTAPVCDKLGTKQCVQCLVANDCSGNANAPICDNKFCRHCNTDTECTGIGPEVCMFHLGRHCATESETVYVKNDRTSLITPCSDTAAGAGSKGTPFCTSQLAIDATGQVPPTDAGAAPDAGAMVAKDLVVLQGPMPLKLWGFGDSRTLTVVGKAGATIVPGTADDGISIWAGIVYLRDLRVSMARTGITTTGGELHADRVIVDGSRAGGISLDNTAFAIANSVIAGGGQATIPTLWSGIFIGTVPAPGPASLINTTIIGNAAGAVVCQDTTSSPSRAKLSGLILWGNSADADFAGNCAVPSAPCCGTDNAARPLDPMFDPLKPYHLSSNSPCIDKLSMNLTPYDIDGEPRPQGAASDCGADEFRATTP